MATIASRVAGIAVLACLCVTRPFGATFGDLLTKPLESGGLALGVIGTSMFFAVVLVLALMRETRVEKSLT